MLKLPDLASDGLGGTNAVGNALHTQRMVLDEPEEAIVTVRPVQDWRMGHVMFAKETIRLEWHIRQFVLNDGYVCAYSYKNKKRFFCRL
jgi:hypothetical protein